MINPLAALLRICRHTVLAALAFLGAPVLLAQPSAALAAAVQSGDRLSYVFLSPGGRSSTINGNPDIWRHAKSLRAGEEGLLYVRQGAAAYVIRDAATLRQVDAIFEPQRALGGKQSELDSRQAELGQRQGKLGAEQARLAHRQSNAPARRAGEFGRQQGELGRQQAELGRQQAALGSEQAELGREQVRLAGIADSKLRRLFAEAIQRGVAQRVD